MLPSVQVDAQGLLDYVRPLLEPVATPTALSPGAWLRQEAARLGDPRSPAAQLGRQLNLPPSYLLIHRVTLGAVGVLCQLGSSGPFRAEMQQWQPGFAEPGTAAAEHAAHANRPGRPLPRVPRLKGEHASTVVLPPPDDTVLATRSAPAGHQQRVITSPSPPVGVEPAFDRAQVVAGALCAQPFGPARGDLPGPSLEHRRRWRRVGPAAHRAAGRLTGLRSR